MIITAIVLAVLSAAGLAVGTHLQHRGVRSAMGPGGRARLGLLACLRQPAWLLGAATIGVATALNVLALALAPVALIQPIGALSLVCAAVISSRALGLRLRRGLVLGITACVVCVAGFVGLSSAYTVPVHPGPDAVQTLGWLLAFLVPCGLGVALSTAGHLPRVVAAGVTFGAVAASVHLVSADVLARLNGGAPLLEEGSTWLLVCLTAAAAGIGAWLVQTAYAGGPPETVLAGLTVIDPVLAVLVSAGILGEYAAVPPPVLLGLIAAGLGAAVGIATVSRHHPGAAGPAVPDAVPDVGTDRGAAGTRPASDVGHPRPAHGAPPAPRAVDHESITVATRG